MAIAEQRFMCALFGVFMCCEVAAAEKWMVVTEYLPPLQYTNTKGEVVGDMTRVVRSILAKAELQAEIVELPWARAEHMARSRPNTLIYSIARTKVREDVFYWVGEIGLSDTGLFALENNKHIKIDSLEDIHRELIGVKRGDVAAAFLEKHLSLSNLQVNTSTIDTVRMLLLGRIDMVPSNQEQLRHYCLVLECEVKHFRKVLQLNDLEEVLYLAANKDSEPGVLAKLSEVTAASVLQLRRQ